MRAASRAFIRGSPATARRRIQELMAEMAAYEYENLA